MPEKMPFLTIITPTHNRAHLLSRCYDSLCMQTDMDFEWIIVDDGSQDNTEEVASGFSSEQIPIIYIKKENGGKHTALNTAHPYVHGRFVLILDSDDFLIPEAVETVRKAWAHYEDNKEIGIVILLRGKNADTPDCTAVVANEPVDIMRSKRIRGFGMDCCEVIRSELFLKYPFPVFSGEKFIAECALWNRVAKTHKCVYINEVIYICEYLEGGLSDSGRNMRLKNPRGGMFTSDLRMAGKNYFPQRVKYGLLYGCYGFFAGLSVREILSGTEHRILVAVCLFPGYILYKRWKKRWT